MQERRFVVSKTYCDHNGLEGQKILTLVVSLVAVGVSLPPPLQEPVQEGPLEEVGEDEEEGGGQRIMVVVKEEEVEETVDNIVKRGLEEVEHAIEDEEVWPVIPYEYGYEISDEESETYYSRTERKSENGDVYGSWSVLLPNYDIQTVVYNVKDGKGFQHTITFTPSEEIVFPL